MRQGFAERWGPPWDPVEVRLWVSPPPPTHTLTGSTKGRRVRCCGGPGGGLVAVDGVELVVATEDVDLEGEPRPHGQDPRRRLHAGGTPPRWGTMGGRKGGERGGNRGAWGGDTMGGAWRRACPQSLELSRENKPKYVSVMALAGNKPVSQPETRPRWTSNGRGGEGVGRQPWTWGD